MTSAALRAEGARLDLHAAEHEAWSRLRRLVGSPLGLGASFAIGVVAAAERPSAARARNVYAKLRTIATRMIWLFELYLQFRGGWQAAERRSGRAADEGTNG